MKNYSRFALFSAVGALAFSGTMTLAPAVAGAFKYASLDTSYARRFQVLSAAMPKTFASHTHWSLMDPAMPITDGSGTGSDRSVPARLPTGRPRGG